ncbi:uncharacterized protein LOC135847076 [Planococcus citri]|uniref:uncharacterized protein LOC135847076 n=1 Tax=Planococcus citri TaxID=170843 RepID=UPI0031F82CC9
MSTSTSTTTTDPIPSIISSLLQTLQNTGINIIDHHLDKNAISLGHNFCAGIAKLKVTYELPEDGTQREQSFVLKIPSQSPFYEQLSALKMYQNEVQMYSTILPAMGALGEVDFAAKSYLPLADDNLVLEDLNELGYEVVNKKNQLDLAHSKLALKALAKLHGLSVKLYEKSRETLEVIVIPPRETPKEAVPSAIFEKFDNTVAVLDIPQEVRAKVHDFVVNIPEKTFNETMLPNENFNVLCHGDFWLGNMLFKHNAEGAVEDIKVVDFQMAHRCSPAIDLIEFFVTSIRFDVYISKRDELIELYLETLNGLLESLKSTARYTRSDLDRDVRRYKLFHLYNLGPYMSAVLSDQEDPFNLSGKDTTIYTSPLYRDALTKWLLHLNEGDML